MKQAVIVQNATVDETLTVLRRAGDRRSEAVVLWLGQREPDRIVVTAAYVPEQEASNDFFRIPPCAMAALLSHLGASGRFIAAQVHSHPYEAFHSAADDKWAVLRHIDALSLVVPFFSRDTSVSTFLDDIAAFRLNARNIWEEIDAVDRRQSIKLV